MLIYLLLGVLQGIFEWIPISSEGIVALASRFFIKEFNAIEVALFLHLGTLLAVLVYFRKDWKEVLMFRNAKLFHFLIISTLVSLIVGFPIYKMVKNMLMGNSLLIMTGFGLLLTAYFQKKKMAFEINFNKLAIIVGFLQGLAVIPGLSRSGSTIFGLSLGKIKPAEILKISYMMSVPVVLASSFYLFLENPTLSFQAWPALFSSFLVGFLSLDFLLKLSQKINFFNFTFIFALLCFLGAIIGFLI
jgi:undecaprenyl-diphosphatase